jgi:hypothetical protein
MGRPLLPHNAGKASTRNKQPGIAPPRRGRDANATVRMYSGETLVTTRPSGNEETSWSGGAGPFFTSASPVSHGTRPVEYPGSVAVCGTSSAPEADEYPVRRSPAREALPCGRQEAGPIHEGEGWKANGREHKRPGRRATHSAIERTASADRQRDCRGQGDAGRTRCRRYVGRRANHQHGRRVTRMCRRRTAKRPGPRCCSTVEDAV